MIQSTKERHAPVSIESAEPSHLARYTFAAGLLRPDDIVLDVPCGTGYGSALMAGHARIVHGVEIDPSAVRHAQEFFSRPNVFYHVGNAERMPFILGHCVDDVVSFEGIEHLDRPDHFLWEVRRVLAPEGTFIISTPRKPHGSEYHVKEYSLEEFAGLLSHYFRIEALYGQISTDIFDLAGRHEDPQAYDRFNFIAIAKHK